MSSERSRQLHKTKKQVERRQAARQVGARETRLQQEIAAARAEWAQRERRHRMACALWVVAAIVAVGHFFEHTGTVNVMSSGLEDLLIGWPTAVLLAVTGGIVYGT